MSGRKIDETTTVQNREAENSFLVHLGTASDRYAGWLGQIYSPEKYAGRITRRTKVIKGKSHLEEVLPVDSVQEYFTHFPLLELDFTFYRPLLDRDGNPTPNHRVLECYAQYITEGDHVILKVPQVITAQQLRKGKSLERNADYLNPKIFTDHFYNPASKILGTALSGFIFEQEYQRSADRPAIGEFAENLDRFFASIPPDDRYHFEIRTEHYLQEPVFEILEKFGVGLVFSHWTWLPPLGKQFAKTGGRFFNAGKQCVVRLLTPLRMGYEDSYAMAYPFDAIIDGMLPSGMIDDTVEIMRSAIDQGIVINVLVNNRSGGNAPLIAEMIAERFLAAAI